MDIPWSSIDLRFVHITRSDWWRAHIALLRADQSILGWSAGIARRWKLSLLDTSVIKQGKKWTFSSKSTGKTLGRLRINGSFDDKTSFDYQRVPLSRSHDETTYDSRIVWFQPVSKSQSQVVMKNAVWTWFVFRHPTEPLVRSTMPRNFVGDDSASCRWDSQQLSRPCAGPGLVTVATVMSPTITTV